MILPIAVQEVIVAYLKADAVITAQVKAEEVRELQWLGDKFTYPNIRVRVGEIRRKTMGCAVFSANVEIHVFSETESSKQADTIIGVIATQMDSHKFVRGGISFSSVTVMTIIPASIEEGGVWHAKLTLSVLMS